jgi:hypothetical protein
MKKLIAVQVAAVMVFASGAFAGTADRVVGESLDNGLGTLSSTYTAKEFLKVPADYVAGEKQDSGLGNVSKEELQRIVAAYEKAQNP